jgi:lipopolysaccharide export system permease protein
MRILRFLNREVLTHTLAVSAVLLVIIVSGRFVKYLAEAAVGDLAADILLPVMLYRMPGFLELIVPLGMFIGILMAYGRLYVESEMVVLSACGISQRRLALYTLAPAMLIALLVGLLSFYVSPLGAARSQALLDDPASSRGINTMTAGRFQVRKRGDTATYTERMDAETGVMSKLFISRRSVDEQGQVQLEVTVAREGEIVFDEDSGARYMELRDGYRYQSGESALDYSITKFALFGERIRDPERGIRDVDPIDGRPTLSLIGSEAPEEIAALHWRIALPIMVPIVALIALTLSRTDHRRGRYVKMAPAFVVYLLYLMLLTNARSALESGELPPALGMWWVHGLFLLVALGLLFLPDWRRRLAYRRQSRE